MTVSQNQPLLVAAFYKFVQLDDPQAFADLIEKFAADRGIRGMVLLAGEGINSTIAGDADAVEALIDYLRTGNVFGGAFRDLEPKFSETSKMPFLRLRVRLKPEIVTLRADGVDPSREVGSYVDPSQWNALLNQDDVTLIDTRNKYETAIGTFEGAVDPALDNFTDFKDYAKKELDPSKNKKVAMFCTGGIRCEKASAYLIGLGFEEVYHLKGGILKYLEEVPEAESKWRGSCFVFDERVGVEHELKVSGHSLCRACRWPLSDDDRAHDDYIDGVQCAYCKDSFGEQKRISMRERQRQMELALSRGEAHIGDQARKDALARRTAKLAQKKRERAKTANGK